MEFWKRTVNTRCGNIPHSPNSLSPNGWRYRYRLCTAYFLIFSFGRTSGAPWVYPELFGYLLTGAYSFDPSRAALLQGDGAFGSHSVINERRPAVVAQGLREQNKYVHVRFEMSPAKCPNTFWDLNRCEERLGDVCCVLKTEL